MAFGGSSQDALVQGEFTIWDALATMGGKGLGLLPVVIATGISYSIGGKPGIAPGFIIGLTANAIGAGFIGGILGGYLAGYLVLAILKYVKLPNWAKGLMPTLIIPFLTSIIGGLIMVYIIGAPIAALIGFGLAFFIAKLFGKNIYTKLEVETLKSAVPMGVINIVEGVIPLVMNDLVRGVVATAIGGFAGGATTMILGADATVPFGGVLMIPTMSRPWAGVIAILVNVVVTAVVLAVIKKNVTEEDAAMQVEKEEDDINLEDIQIF